MPSSNKAGRRRSAVPAAATKSLPGSQTLWRALNVLEAVAGGAVRLNELAEAVKLTRSTTHRLAAALVNRRYLGLHQGSGYFLGSKLLELGFQAQGQIGLAELAHSHLEKLAQRAGDAAFLGVLDDYNVLYLDRVRGKRRLALQTQIGDREPLRSAALGKALLLDDDEDRWASVYAAGEKASPGAALELTTWIGSLREYAKRGVAYEIEETPDRTRGIAVPIRDARGQIVGALGIVGAAQYLADERMKTLTKDVKEAGAAVSRELGWAG